MSLIQLRNLFTPRKAAPEAVAPLTPRPGQRVLHSRLDHAISTVHADADRHRNSELARIGKDYAGWNHGLAKGWVA